MKLTRTRPAGRAPVYRRYDMCEWEVAFDRGALHLDLLAPVDCHDAYDADHQGVLFRADITFTHPKAQYVVPVFRAQDRRGRWRWLVRFRPSHAGRWELSVFAVHWHRNPHASGEPEGSRKSIRYDGTTITCYQHVVGPLKLPGFDVVDTAPYLEGPLDTPGAGENRNYFYRRTADGKRRAWLVMGCARPWVGKTTPQVNRPYWDPFINRQTELYAPIAANRGNALYHWFAPGETSLVHQASDEYWFDPGSGYMKERKRAQPTIRGSPWPGGKLWADPTLPPPPEARRAYKEYDQGRAEHIDRIFDQARVGDRYIQLFVVVMPHDLLQASGHDWGEWGWSEQSPERRRDNNGRDAPCQMNGFHFFDRGTGRPLELDRFFDMNPAGTGAQAWQARLWKHYANFWRYVIGRWTAHPALGAWVLMDELEGVGNSTGWWWAAPATSSWHDRLVKLVRGEMQWGEIDVAGVRKTLVYTGDYLRHPLTSSATHYKWSDPGRYLNRYGTPDEKRALDEFRRTGSAASALQIIERPGELPRRADWWYGSDAACSIDFASHHLYQAVPYWGHWGLHPTTHRFEYLKNTRDPRFGLVLSNEDQNPMHLEPNRWMWDSLCMRLRNWSAVNVGRLRVVTEFGCVERNWPPPTRRGVPGETWDRYGKRVPAYMHFGCWAALVLGHAGTPFKWNDAQRFGEMSFRTSRHRSPVWDRSVYPVNNYAEWTRIAAFVGGVDLGRLYPREAALRVVEPGGNVDSTFRAWGLADAAWSTLLVRIYDRTFTTNGRPVSRALMVSVGPKSAGQKYACTWFDTWNGGDIAGGTQQADSKGELRVPLAPFRASRDPAVRGADGNDIALRLVAAA